MKVNFSVGKHEIREYQASDCLFIAFQLPDHSLKQYLFSFQCGVLLHVWNVYFAPGTASPLPLFIPSTIIVLVLLEIEKKSFRKNVSVLIYGIVWLEGITQRNNRITFVWYLHTYLNSLWNFLVSRKLTNFQIWGKSDEGITLNIFLNWTY